MDHRCCELGGATPCWHVCTFPWAYKVHLHAITLEILDVEDISAEPQLFYLLSDNPPPAQLLNVTTSFGQITNSHDPEWSSGTHILLSMMHTLNWVCVWDIALKYVGAGVMKLSQVSHPSVIPSVSDSPFIPPYLSVIPHSFYHSCQWLPMQILYPLPHDLCAEAKLESISAHNWGEVWYLWFPTRLPVILNLR